MSDKIYAIVDIETTGGRASRDKITEIAIVLHDGEDIIDTYETLINPECSIPYGITELTGINQEMVADAPKFYEVARKIVEMTEDCILWHTMSGLIMVSSVRNSSDWDLVLSANNCARCVWPEKRSGTWILRPE